MARFSKKKLLNKKYVFWFSLQHLSEIFLILRRTERDVIMHVIKSSCKVPVIKFKFSRQNFEKYSNIKFHKNPFSGSRVVPCGRRDRQMKLIVAICNFANAPKMTYIYTLQITLFACIVVVTLEANFFSFSDEWA